jgi:hypothetical protein
MQTITTAGGARIATAKAPEAVPSARQIREHLRKVSSGMQPGKPVVVHNHRVSVARQFVKGHSGRDRTVFVVEAPKRRNAPRDVVVLNAEDAGYFIANGAK